MKNSKLFIYPSGLWLEDDRGNDVTECSITTEIESLSAPLIAEWIIRCNQYGFYPELVISERLKVA